MKIQPTQSADLAALQNILDQTQLFPSDMLPDMIAPFFSNPDTSDIWFTVFKDATPVGFCYTVPEQMADRVWNMLAIAVLPSAQGTGCGTALVQALENSLKTRSQRLLIADTSGTADFSQTRNFYRKNRYTEESRIRNFWADGDDKITFSKALS